VTRCVSADGSHPFPIEDESGAYCPEHGVTLVFHPVYTGEGFSEGPTPPPEPSQGPGQRLYAR